MDKNYKIQLNFYAILMSIFSLIWIPITIAPYAQSVTTYIIICVFWLLMAGCLFYVLTDILNRGKAVIAQRRNISIIIAAIASIALLLLTRIVINNVYTIAIGAVISIYLARALTQWSMQKNS